MLITESMGICGRTWSLPESASRGEDHELLQGFFWLSMFSPFQGSASIIPQSIVLFAKAQS